MCNDYFLTKILYVYMILIFAVYINCMKLLQAGCKFWMIYVQIICCFHLLVMRVMRLLVNPITAEGSVTNGKG